MHDGSSNGTTNNMFRSFIGLLCSGVYWLLSGAYEILINIAKTDFINSELIIGIFNKIQLIIGIFITFRLIIVILQGIVDPDRLTDSKNGAASIIIKVLTALVLLSLVIPLNNITVDKNNDYEKAMKEQGILFGTLSEFQERILRDGTLYKLFLQKDLSESIDEIEEKNISAGENLSATVLKGFLTPNLISDEVIKAKQKQIEKKAKEEKPNIDAEELRCKKSLFKCSYDKQTKKWKYSSKYKEIFLYCYQKQDEDAEDWLSIGNLLETHMTVTTHIMPGIREFAWAYDAYQSLAGKENVTSYDIYYATKDTGQLFDLYEESACKVAGNDRYMFNFNWFSGLLVGLVFLVVLIILCLEVAKRVIKLAILRLIAPIPIISYINPGSSFENSSLGSWVKLLTSTYLDLFLNLTIIYFIIFIISQMSSMPIGTGEFSVSPASIIAKIFIFLGLLLFAKDAPKFIKQAMGIKSDGNGFFGGLAAAAGLGALGAKKLAGGTISAATGNGFMNGANQFKGKGPLSTAWDNYKKLNPRHDARKERKKIEKNLSAGEKAYNKAFDMANMVDEKGEKAVFTGNPNDNSYGVFKNKDFIKTKMANDKAKKDFEDADAVYKEADSNNSLTKDIIDDYQKKKGIYDNAKENHEINRKYFSDDAKLEDQFKYYKNNKDNGGVGSSYSARRGSTAEGNSNNLNFNPHGTYTRSSTESSSGTHAVRTTSQGNGNYTSSTNSQSINNNAKNNQELEDFYDDMYDNQRRGQ